MVRIVFCVTVVRYLWNYPYPNSKVHGAYMGPTWGRQDPSGTRVGPMNLAIRVSFRKSFFVTWLVFRFSSRSEKKCVYIFHVMWLNPQRWAGSIQDAILPVWLFIDMSRSWEYNGNLYTKSAPWDIKGTCHIGFVRFDGYYISLESDLYKSRLPQDEFRLRRCDINIYRLDAICVYKCYGNWSCLEQQRWPSYLLHRTIAINGNPFVRYTIQIKNIIILIIYQRTWIAFMFIGFANVKVHVSALHINSGVPEWYV